MRYFILSLCMFSLAGCGPNFSDDGLLSSKVSSALRFPLAPHPKLTPGKTCKQADEYRHPEQIKYCSRDVSTWQKNDVIAEYDRRLNYNVAQMNRQEFKVDHLIPLCLGGSNNSENLWPQHRTLYLQTDDIEHKLCILLQTGRIEQVEAIELVIQSKVEIKEAPQIEAYLDRLLAL